MALRALAHPLRVRLLDALRAEEASTATELSRLLGESVASCSYHLRILAKYGFIRPAQRSGGKERPWEPAPMSFAIVTSTLSPAERAQANAAARYGRQSFFEQLERWADETDRHPRDWQDAGFAVGAGLWLTAAELTDLRRDLEEVLDRYHGRDRNRPGAARISFQAWGFPAPGNPDLLSGNESSSKGDDE